MDKLKINQLLDRVYSTAGKYQQQSGHYEPSGHFWVGDVELMHQQAIAWREAYKPNLPVIILDCAKVRELGKTPATESRAIMREILTQYGDGSMRIPTDATERAHLLDRHAKQRDSRILLLLNPQQLRASTFKPLSFNLFKYNSSPQWDWILAANSREKLQSLKIAETCVRLFIGI
jgi:hypothetical protein